MNQVANQQLIASSKPKRPQTSSIQAKQQAQIVIPSEKIQLLQLINQVNQQTSQTPLNNQGRRISLVVPQPQGGQTQITNVNALNFQSQQQIPPMQTQINYQHIPPQHSNTSVESRKKNATDKKKRNHGKVSQNNQEQHHTSSSVERVSSVHHKNHAQSQANNHSYNQLAQSQQLHSLNLINANLQHHEQSQNSNKKKSSVSRVGNHSNIESNGVSIINQKVMPKTLNTVYTQEQLKVMRNQTLSPPPNSKTKGSSALQNILSKSNSKQNGDNGSVQKQSKRISQLKCLVKKQQQQKSLSRDFTNTLINTRINSATNKQSGQFQLFKSHNSTVTPHNQNSQNITFSNQSLQSNQTLLNGALSLTQGLYHQLQLQQQNSINNSLSPNSRLALINSSQKKKKKQIIKKKKDPNADPLTQSVQLFKPPINKSIQNALMQTSLNLKTGFNSILNESKDQSLTRINISQQPNNTSVNLQNQSLVNFQSHNTTLNQNQIINLRQQAQQIHNQEPKTLLSSANTSGTVKSQSKKQTRNSTQERLMKVADDTIQQINQELNFTNSKKSGIISAQQQSMSSSQTSLQPERLKKLVQNTLQQTQCEYLNKENSAKQVALGGANSKKQGNIQQYNSTYIKTDDLFQLDKTFSDIIETIQNNSIPSDNQIQQMKQQANLTLIKSQLEKIKNSYEQIIKKLSDQQNNQSLSARLKQQRLLSDRNDDDNTTTHATNSNNDCFSASSSFRTQQTLLNQAQLQQKIHELEQKNLQLSATLKQKDETISHQESIIQFLKQEVKKEDACIQTQSDDHTASVGQMSVLTERKADLIVDNEQLRRQVKRMQKKIEYHKNKENKFLFFLFSLQNQGIPVNEIYEKEGIKDIPTSRFAEIMADEQNNPANQSSVLFSFYTDDSYEPIDDGPDPAKIKQKPAFIPALNLNNLPEYESSSDEEEDNKQGDGGTNQQELAGRQYIDNFYNKCMSQGINQHTIDSDEREPAVHEDEDDECVMEDDRNLNLGDPTEQDYVMCQINQGSSILLFEKEDMQSNMQPSQMNPASMMMDDDFCYSVDKYSKRRLSQDMRSI